MACVFRALNISSQRVVAELHDGSILQDDFCYQSGNHMVSSGLFFLPPDKIFDSLPALAR